MSSAAAASKSPAPKALPAVEGWRRPTLRLVRQPIREAPKLPFVVLVVALLGAGLVGLLLLSMQRAQASFAQGSLATRNAALADQVQALARAVESDEAPSALASRAAALGMVPAGSAGYLGAGGQILGPVPSGAPTPASGAPARGGIVVGISPLPTVAVHLASRPVAVRPSAAASAAARLSSSPSVAASPSAPTGQYPTPTPTRTGTR